MNTPTVPDELDRTDLGPLYHGGPAIVGWRLTPGVTRPQLRHKAPPAPWVCLTDAYELAELYAFTAAQANGYVYEAVPIGPVYADPEHAGLSSAKSFVCVQARIVKRTPLDQDRLGDMRRRMNLAAQAMELDRG